MSIRHNSLKIMRSQAVGHGTAALAGLQSQQGGRSVMVDEILNPFLDPGRAFEER
ncbi:hypothetical protein [Aureimonas sp. ME7]|uniref:hypothetical protein n=1 Tax=Aureimonas sp. ME7 TaxID=2744252 RepID=UPI0015F5EE83|nr:hypothetical protein [Aureimonas sp. ME7]